MHLRSGMLLASTAIALAACGASAAGPAAPLDGVWQVGSAATGVPPRQMTLTQTGTSVTGTGTAVGADVPIPVAITGTWSAPTAAGPAIVTLHFALQNGGGITGDYTGTLSAADSLTGTSSWYGIVTNGPVTGPLTFSRIPFDTLPHPAGATGLEGVVTRGPVTPVCLVGVPCYAPFAAAFTVSQGQQAVARFQSDSAGRYEVLLAPGAYTVAPDSGAAVWPQGQSRPVTVGPFGITRADLQFDTGIR
jgi:hypothetical protein